MIFEFVHFGSSFDKDFVPFFTVALNEIGWICINFYEMAKYNLFLVLVLHIFNFLWKMYDFLSKVHVNFLSEVHVKLKFIHYGFSFSKDFVCFFFISVMNKTVQTRTKLNRMKIVNFKNDTDWTNIIIFQIMGFHIFFIYVEL